jgi:hypothetical protein
MELFMIDNLIKPRILVLSDIGHEPDDQQSLVRLLTYANEFDIEGLIATTSRFQKNEIHPEIMVKVIKAYGGIPRDNLMIHTENYFPSEKELLSVVKNGADKYGMEAVRIGQYSEGSEWVIKVVDKPDPRPLWITIWGGSNTLAQALWSVREMRDQGALNQFLAKLRVYAISDQDNSGKWIRENFPYLFYIVSPTDSESKIDELGYNDSTWVGISGEHFYKFKGGPNSKLVTNSWLRKNIRENHGSLGKVYPRSVYIMEGDTPSFLNLIPNGLRSSQSPTFGGWGGRYSLYQPEGESRLIYTDSEDTVVVGDGFGEIQGDVNGTYSTNQATIWRWREAYQHDFAARMDWASTSNIIEANHPPLVKIQGELDRNVKGSDLILLDASDTSDPDGHKLSFCWFHYKEAGNYDGNLTIKNPSEIRTNLTFNDQYKSGFVHIILEVKDNGEPNLYRYARIILRVN